MIDTDVVVIIIGKFHHLLTNNPSVRIWVACGTVKAFSYLDINAICHALGQSKSLALPFFHCFTVRQDFLVRERSWPGKLGNATLM